VITQRLLYNPSWLWDSAATFSKLYSGMPFYLLPLDLYSCGCRVRHLKLTCYSGGWRYVLWNGTRLVYIPTTGRFRDVLVGLVETDGIAAVADVCWFSLFAA